LADKFNSLQMGVIAASRVFTLMDEEAEVRVQSSGTKLPMADNSRRGLHIKISDLYFGYDPERPVLRGLNLELNQGEVVAVVGGSGCGKSTLAQLLVRFYDANSGVIEINGRGLETYPLQELRHRMVYVPQELFLINGTVLDNIALLNAGLDGPTVEARIRAWNLEEFLDKLPQGLDTPVGERGLLLSAGQRQLVALMRAMVLDPDLLILDEATASIDSKTEAMVQRGIESFVQGRNALLIAHRLSTLRFAYRIVVLEAGVVVESGTYATLLELKGRFWALHQAQQVNSGALQEK
jgi:ABC-type multidrug transport system fused ATPase/permease subunit